MGTYLNITLGIPSGGLISILGLMVIQECSTSSVKNSLENHQTLTGTVVEEFYDSGFLKDSYNLSIKTPEGKKISVQYGFFITNQDCTQLSVLFSPGDHVELQVAKRKDKKEYGFYGLSAKLVQ